MANSLAAIRLGAVQVHGTINGYGERCGNANLCSIIPALKLKMGIDCVSDANLAKLRDVSRYVDELANLPHRKRQPYIGDSAFAHKAGVHVDAVAKNPLTYEHIIPDQVGNKRRILVSDMAGKSNILQKAAELNIPLSKDSPELGAILKKVKELENEGFEFEGAEGSLELLMLRAGHNYESVFTMFDRIDYRILTEKRKVDPHPVSEATVTVEVGGNVEHTAAWGNGPVNALDKALRKVLPKYFPGKGLENVRLLDYKVRVLTAAEGTAARVRVLIESGRRQEQVGHGRRVRERDRGELAGAGGQHRVQAAAGEEEKIEVDCRSAGIKCRICVMLQQASEVIMIEEEGIVSEIQAAWQRWRY